MSASTDEFPWLSKAFVEIFPLDNPQPFGNPASRYQGVSDGNDGVQW